MMTESRVRAQIACWSIDRLGTDPASAERVAHALAYAKAMISVLKDEDVDVALAEVDRALDRWQARLCEETTGEVERVELRDVTLKA